MAAPRPRVERLAARAAAEEDVFEIGGYLSTRLAVPRGPAGAVLVLRRLVGEVEGQPGRFRFATEVELEGAGAADAAAEGGEAGAEHELELEQAWLGYALSPHVIVRAGAVLPPVGRVNARNEDHRWNFARRPLIDRAVPVLPGRAAWRALGVAAEVEWPLGTGTLAVEVDALSPAERQLSIRPAIADGTTGEAVVRPGEALRLGGSHPFSGAARLSVRSAAGSELGISGQAGPLAAAGGGGSGDEWTLGLDGAHRIRGLRLEGEALYSRSDGLSDLLRALFQESAGAGGAARSFELRGLSRVRYGYWLDLELPIALPALPLAASPVVVPLVRVEQVHLLDAVSGFATAGATVTALERASAAASRVTLGAALRPVPSVVLHAGLERMRTRGDALLGLPPDAAASGIVMGLVVGF